MRIFKKEKRVVELALEHTAITAECMAIMVQAIGAYAAGDDAGLEEAAQTVCRKETQADDLLREIRGLLYSGAYLPTIRGDLYRLLSTIDHVTNRIESCLRFVNLQRPARVSQFSRQFEPILGLTSDCYGQLQNALAAFFKPKGEIDDLRASAKRVGEIESEIDEQQGTLITAIFASELELAEKLHLADMLVRIGHISDQVENAADELELLSLKSII
jgi:predicted phosphate transport protein (TIGR00153 family)